LAGEHFHVAEIWLPQQPKQINEEPTKATTGRLRVVREGAKTPFSGCR